MQFLNPGKGQKSQKTKKSDRPCICLRASSGFGASSTQHFFSLGESGFLCEADGVGGAAGHLEEVHRLLEVSTGLQVPEARDAKRSDSKRGGGGGKTRWSGTRGTSLTGLVFKGCQIAIQEKKHANLGRSRFAFRSWVSVEGSATCVPL